MPVAIPIIASFAAAGSAIAAAGGVIAAMSTFTGFLAVAGAALTGIGAITGKKDLVKIGSLMTLGSSLATAASSASSTAASEAAAEQAAQESFRAAEYSDMAAYSGDTAATAGTTQPAISGLEQAQAEAASAGVKESAIDPLARATDAAEEVSIWQRGAQSAGIDTAAGESSSILDKLTTAQEPGSTVLGDINRQALQIGVEPSAAVPTGVTINGQVIPTDRIAQYASQTPASQIQATNNAGVLRAKTALGGSGNGPLSELTGWLERNPNVALVGGKMLAGMYGPDAEAIDFQKSIYERKRANLNRPVALTFGKA